MIFWGTVLSLNMVIFLTFLSIREYKRDKELITPLTLFSGLSIIDIYLPGILFLNTGVSNLPPWIKELTDIDLVYGIFYFTIGCFFFLFGYSLVRRNQNKYKEIKDEILKPRIKLQLNFNLMYIFLFVTGLWYFLSMWYEVNVVGSLSAYISSKLYLRWIPEPTKMDSFFWSVIFIFRNMMFSLFLVIVGLAFYFRKQHKKPFIWGLFIPIIGWMFTLTTFFRGTQISYFISLFILEVFRYKEEVKYNYDHYIKKKKRTYYVYIIIGILLFISYGIVREYYSVRESNLQTGWGETITNSAKDYLQGHSLIGISSIIKNYGNNIEYLKGKTIIDMLLLPIPRSIWPSKPKWYGIDDITRAMGWPESTQSAVTMPGELYANFGFLGLVLMIVYGIIFGYIYVLRKSGRNNYIYAFVLLPMMFVTFWMSFTGFMNAIIKIPLIFVALFLLLKKNI